MTAPIDPRRARTVTAASMAAVTIGFALLTWQRRWISDDGLIVVRTVRQILAGNGPVFNAFERTEACTSTAWTWIVALFAWLGGRDVVRVAIALGGVCSIAGVALALDGARRLHRGRGSTAMLVPAGALVVVGVAPFWDFATSGLETGLCTLWIAAIWRVLVSLRADARAPRQAAAAFVFGLGPLVRPDLAIASAVFLIAAWMIVRPRWRRTLALAAIAAALPVAYELFRAGYYGALVPLPALAKSATHAQWLRGVRYLGDLAWPYLLFVPLAILVALGVVAHRRRPIAGRDRIVVGAPIIAGALMALYVIRVGGDFMHARMLLPAAFMMLLPVMLVPLRRFTAPAVAALAAWALVIGVWRGDGRDHTIAPNVHDERAGYAAFLHDPHPTDADAFIRAQAEVATRAGDAIRDGRRVMISEWGERVAMNPARPGPIALVVGRLGTGGAIAPLDGIVGDTLGLANPIGARIPITGSGGAGHEKQLPWTWVRADFADPATDEQMMPADIRAARHAMTCGALADLLASVRAPMTADRFWDNLTGSIGRTTLVIPSDPFDAERAFCDAPLDPDLALGAAVTVSSERAGPGWSPLGVVDGARAASPARMGYASAIGPAADHHEWIELTLPSPRTISKVVLHPVGTGTGFPVDFRVQVWAGVAWIDRVARRAVPDPGGAPQTFAWREADLTDRIRLDVTRLRAIGNEGYGLQLAEIELLP